MRTLLIGKDVDVSVEVDGEMQLIMCAISFSKDETAEEVNITTADSGRQNEYIGGSLDCTISFEGAITLDIPGKYQYEDLVNDIGNVKRILIEYRNSHGDLLSYEADFLITSVSDQNPVEHSTFSMTAKRSGAPTITKTWDEEVILDEDDEPLEDESGEVIRG
jgi:hypothetical protein